MREDDGVRYGGLQRSGDEGFLAAAHEVCISNLFLSLMLGIRVLSGKKKNYWIFQLIQIRPFLNPLQGSS